MRTHRFVNGDEMPLFGLGTWQAVPGAVEAAVTRALELGYRHIDCSPIYDNEPEIGAAFETSFGSDLRREDVWVTSKLWNNAHRAEHVIPAIEQTLESLRIDQLDLYLIHWPVAQRHDVTFPESADQMVSLDDVPIAETWAAMETVVDRGLARHIGVSNFSAKKIADILGYARVRPEVDQVELHPYLQQGELLDFCARNDVLVTAYSPLGSPARPDRLRMDGEPVLLDDEVVTSISAAHGATPAQVLIAWALGRGTAVIPKTVSLHRLEENLAGSRLELTSEDMSRLGALDRHRRYIPGDFWAKPGSDYTVGALWDE